MGNDGRFERDNRPAPVKRFADIIIPEGGQNRVAREMILAMLQKFVRDVDLARSDALSRDE